MITLARATLTGAELDNLDEICRSQPDYWRCSGDQDPDTMTRASIETMLREDAEAEGCETVVAWDESGRVVGFAQLLLRHPGDGHPWIGLLLVDGRLPRRGNGRAIVEALEGRFRAEGATALRLGVLEVNAPAQPFWSALGYHQIDLRPDRAKARPTLVMEKLLLETCFHRRGQLVLCRVLQPGPAEVEQQHDPVGASPVPRRMLNRVVEDQRLALAPPPDLATHLQAATVGHNQSEMRAIDSGHPPLVRRDVRPGRHPGEPGGGQMRHLCQRRGRAGASLQRGLDPLAEGHESVHTPAVAVHLSLDPRLVGLAGKRQALLADVSPGGTQIGKEGKSFGIEEHDHHDGVRPS